MALFSNFGLNLIFEWIERTNSSPKNRILQFENESYWTIEQLKYWNDSINENSIAWFESPLAHQHIITLSHYQNRTPIRTFNLRPVRYVGMLYWRPLMSSIHWWLMMLLLPIRLKTSRETVPDSRFRVNQFLPSFFALAVMRSRENPTSARM